MVLVLQLNPWRNPESEVDAKGNATPRRYGICNAPESRVLRNARRTIQHSRKPVEPS
jgi:hypothetical protein